MVQFLIEAEKTRPKLSFGLALHSLRDARVFDVAEQGTINPILGRFSRLKCLQSRGPCNSKNGGFGWCSRLFFDNESVAHPDVRNRALKPGTQDMYSLIIGAVAVCMYIVVLV